MVMLTGMSNRPAARSVGTDFVSVQDVVARAERDYAAGPASESLDLSKTRSDILQVSGVVVLAVEACLLETRSDTVQVEAHGQPPTRAPQDQPIAWYIAALKDTKRFRIGSDPLENP